MPKSSSNSSEDETPRPRETFDFDFFDSDHGVDKKNLSKKSSSYLRSDPTENDDTLHGSGRKDEKYHSVKSDAVVEQNEQFKSAPNERYTSSAQLEVKRVYRTTTTSTTSPKRPESKEKITVHVPHEVAKDSSTSSDSDSSDSVTDVSPLSSDATPRPETRKRQESHVVKASSKRSTRHDVEEARRPPGRRGNGEALSIEDLLYSSESSHKSSDEKDIEMQRKKRVHRKRRSRYEEVQQRNEASMHQHRRRLLDVAAENSMDLSQLLEVVLEMEQDNQSRKMYPSNGAYRNALPPPMKPPQKKNLSFSNDQVHQIDRENQRLLKRLAQLNTRPQRPSSASSVRSSASSCRSSASTSRSNRRPFSSSSARISPNRGPRAYHSTTNRLRDQQRIERENLALLKRLQVTKSSSTLRRDNLLRDYERQTGRVTNPVPRSSARRRQRMDYSRCGDYDNESLRHSQHKGRPAWQD